MKSADSDMKKNLRSGYTTGACAAAAAKAAALLVTRHASRVPDVEIPFPDGSRVKFVVQSSESKKTSAMATVIKDAGDDPDVTNGAEIVAEARLVGKCESAEARKINNQSKGFTNLSSYELVIKGGKGVGKVTKPGLSVPVGEPAINPVPRKMIEDAVMEAVWSAEERKSESSEVKDLRSCDLTNLRAIEITISVPKGEELAKKTLNYRLGIEGGISILGTTGIVKPVSTEAWTATITSSMDVANATGQRDIVVSAGRSSEKAHISDFNFPEESYVLMGDYLEFSLKEAVRHDFKQIHLCAQWAKMVKIAMATPQTHVRFGAINVKKAVQLLNSIGFDIPEDSDFNTAREIYDCIEGAGRAVLLQRVCNAAKEYAESITGGSPVITYLVSYDGKVISQSE